MQVQSKNIILSGAVGDLEAVIDERAESVTNDYIAVCCHPHPQHGGAMGNKVIYTASRTLAALGVISIRFNFRGVGKSEGSYADGIGEQDDLIAVVKWSQKQHPDKKLILCGFSFGAHISAMQAAKLGADLLISIAPPIGRIAFNGFEPPMCDWLIIQGENDELVDAEKVKDWSNEFLEPPKLVMMPEASHFFHGKLLDLRESIESFCHSTIDAGSQMNDADLL